MKKYIVMGMSLLLVGVMGLVVITQTWSAHLTENRAQAETLPPKVIVDTSHQDTIRYTNYSPVTFNQLASQRRVLFFDASWCQNCQGADKEISAQTDKIPSNVTVFKVDFDSEKALRQKYSVTNQHTFVQVNAQGEVITAWNGGGIDELISKLM